MDGRQLAQQVKALSPNTPVILLTGWGKGLDEPSDTAGLVDAWLGKPPRIAEIKQTLARVCANLAGPTSSNHS